MMYWNGEWSWAGWLAMTLSMVVFWGAVAWVVITLVRRPADQGRRRAPDEILAERFARGEIDEDEYARRRKALRTGD